MLQNRREWREKQRHDTERVQDNRRKRLGTIDVSGELYVRAAARRFCDGEDLVDGRNGDLLLCAVGPEDFEFVDFCGGT